MQEAGNPACDAAYIPARVGYMQKCGALNGEEGSGQDRQALWRAGGDHAEKRDYDLGGAAEPLSGGAGFASGVDGGAARGLRPQEPGQTQRVRGPEVAQQGSEPPVTNGQRDGPVSQR